MSGVDDLRGVYTDDPDFDLEPAEARDLCSLVVYGMNARDGEDSLGAILWETVAEAIKFIEDQPCSCPHSWDYPPCRRCQVLGQRDRELVER